MALSITAGNGGAASQASTQNPQTSAGSGAPGAAPSSSVQPGTATTLLNGGQNVSGVPLHNTALPTVNLVAPPTPAPAAVSQAATTSSKHHVNSTLLGFSIVLFVAAIGLFWAVSRSVKSTTKY